jgi:hypothetical protein
VKALKEQLLYAKNGYKAEKFTDVKYAQVELRRN